MKKILLLLAIIMTTALLSYSQDSLMSQLPDTSKLTVFKVYNDVKAGIVGLSSALKVGAVHVYEVLIKQQYVTSIVNIIVLLLLFCIAITSFKFFVKNQRRTLNKGDDWYSDNWGDHTSIILPMVVCIVFSISFLANFCCNIKEIITGFVNPEYGAMKDIINFVK